MGRIRVQLVEDEPATQRRIADAISRGARCELTSMAATLAEGRARLAGGACDVLVTDLKLPDGSGLELIREARGQTPPVSCLVITVLADQSTALACLQAGASGYLLKDAPVSDIEQAIVDVQAGAAPVSPEIATYLLQALGYAAPSPVSSVHLADREVTVLKLISRGFTDGEISGMLGISPHTVKTYLKRVYRKLEVHTRTAAVFEARQLGLIRDGE